MSQSQTATPSDVCAPKVERLAALHAHVAGVLGSDAQRVAIDAGELKVLTTPASYLRVAQTLRDDPLCRFEQLIDLCAVDYSAYREGTYEGARYCVVSQLLSVSLNQRLRLKVFAQGDDLPILPSLTPVWSSANWYEREAFDLFGVVFEGHSDLRRILTDYGFIGHPMRKDFALSGHVEMRYDEELGRVLYQPLTIEPREQTPRIIREEGYAGSTR